MTFVDDDVVGHALVAEGFEEVGDVAAGDADPGGVAGEAARGADGGPFESHHHVLSVDAPEAGDGDGEVGAERAVDDHGFFDVEVTGEGRAVGGTDGVAHGEGGDAGVPEGDGGVVV